jgi:hypothetical protein
MPDAQHRDLSAAFAAPAKGKDRAAALSGLLTPKLKKSAAEVTAEPTASPASPETAGTHDGEVTDTAPERTRRSTEPAPRRRAPARAVTAPAADEVVNLPVYLPDDLRAQMLAFMPRGTTYADVLLEAFEGVTEERLMRYFVPTIRTSASGMPLAPQAPNPGTGPQRQFRVRKAQLDWITQLAERVNAPNRSVLCVAVLRLHLDDRAASGKSH